VNQTEKDCCERLTWDSEFFGMGIGRVRTNHLTSAILESTERWCVSNAIECLYFLGEADDASSIRSAEAFGFGLVDIRLTLAQRIRPAERAAAGPQGPEIRVAQPGDLEPLRTIARSSYQDSRFYFDGHFPLAKCDHLYETWLEKSCVEPSGVVLVAEWHGSPAGYVTCDRVDEATGQIGLLGVGSSAQGVGLGSALINSAVGWFQGQGFSRAQVVTQGRNVRAQAAYQRCGFLTESLQLWYHRWFDHASEGRRLPLG
jgi:GNAT superfamily N-acetyltransferase